MRDRYEIKTEIDAVQEDLQNNLAELKGVIVEKVDIKAKLQHKVDETKQRALEYTARGRRALLDYVGQARAFVRDKPWIAAGIAGGVVLVGAAIFAIRRQFPEEPRPVTMRELRAALGDLREP